ncbi:N-acetylmuramoyl-L-alanine amidase [Bombilactobacillus thymidiniphilus]|uniref:N-acetylmuramoyl-L-alanine amidase n=1 Tax=Bombilactobacillus thymidiniphilus TaxID=2923363 RepID=A0ABY4PE36_9LACO|nr:N-acetylmuramoyl-L-alanine amidase [Bombilactobacillus thymidiniphilus]UQS83532.1 N-acetylmuramoyl-L-alanine amidase [Bombilactobacillus thymidiniphilus]
MNKWLNIFLHHTNHSYWKVLAISILLLISAGATYTAAQANKVTVQANFLNVRMGPGLSYDTMTQIKRGETLTILSEKDQWYQVRLAQDKIGWVASWLIDNDDANTNSNSVGVIKAPNTNVQKYPEQDSEVLGTLSQSQKVNIVYSQNDWSQILYNNTVGWIPNSEMIITDKVPGNIKNQKDNAKQTEVDIKSVTTLQNNTKILRLPNDSGKVIAHVTDQTTLPYLGKSGKFYKIRLNSGLEGYIDSGMVSISDTEHAIKTAATQLSEATIVIDPGHGGRDTGAISANKKYEKTYTLKTAQLLQQKLQQAGANVVMTRDSDSDTRLATRARTANKLNADAFISLHFDSSNNKQASGTTTYYYYPDKDKRLADCINQKLTQISLPNRGTHFGNYEVTRENEQPAILIEGGYLSSKHDFKKISSSQYQEQLADSIFKGLVEYFK